LGKELNAFGGRLPLKLFCCTVNASREEMFQIEFGIIPVKLLKPKVSLDKLDDWPKDEGIAPKSSF